MIKTEMKMVNEFLENTYVGARENNDIECMTRLARAIAAFNAEVDQDIFTEDFEEIYYQKNV